MNKDLRVPRIVTLTTDFGIDDGYAATIKGVVLSLNPDVRIIDISNTIRPQDILQAAFVIHSAYKYFPENSIHLVIVDPGVGSNRKALVVKTREGHFLAPDNGVLTYILDNYYPSSKKFVSHDTILFGRKRLPDDIEAID